MRRTQTLGFGLIVRQNIRDFVRPVFFETGYPEYPYATHGGTLFLIIYCGRVYALTCRHVFGDFAEERLFVAARQNAKVGCPRATLKTICYPSSPYDMALGTDITDLCLLEFTDDIGAEFFDGSCYIIDENTTATSKPGDMLLVHGVLKEKVNLSTPEMSVRYCRLEFIDQRSSSDPVLRRATAQYIQPEFREITCISGSPVYNLTTNCLCGMVMRGCINGNTCEMHYVDIFDILRFIEAVNAKHENIYYKKNVMLPVFSGVDEVAGSNDKHPDG